MFSRKDGKMKNQPNRDFIMGKAREVGNIRARAEGKEKRHDKETRKDARKEGY